MQFEGTVYQYNMFVKHKNGRHIPFIFTKKKVRYIAAFVGSYQQNICVMQQC
jgi:hypothetical protein